MGTDLQKEPVGRREDAALFSSRLSIMFMSQRRVRIVGRGKLPKMVCFQSPFSFML